MHIRRVLNIIVVAATAASLVAADSGNVVEVEDGCGADSHVLGTGVPHPTPEATDIDTVDLRGAYVGEDATYVGLDVVLTTCGDELDLSTRERVAVGWQTEDSDVDGCDATSSFLTFDRDLETAEFAGTLEVNCYVYGDCPWPLGVGGSCGSLTVTDIKDVPLTDSQFVRDGRTFTARLRLDDLDATVATTLQPGLLLENVYIHGSSFAGAHVSTGESGAYNVSLIDRGDGLDHRLGADA